MNLAERIANHSQPRPKPPWWNRRQPGQIVPVALPCAEIELNLYVATGTRPGPTLVVLGAVHGNEHEGPMAIARLLVSLNLTETVGTIVALPVVNPPAFVANTRESPLDGCNLARMFPGREDGSPSEQLAWLVTHQAIAVADVLIDLHSAGVAYEMALLAGHPHLGDEHGELSREVSIAFGAPVVWEHPVTAPGRTLSVAIDMGIPCMYAESAGGGGAPEDVVQCYVDGVQRVMVALGMSSGEVRPRHRRFWRGDGNIDDAIEATTDGLFHSFVRVGDRVQAGAVVGEIIDYDGRVVESLTARLDGVVALTRRTPRVATGDGLYVFTTEVDESSDAIKDR